MSRRTRIVRNLAIGVAAFTVVVLAVTILVVQTEWFRGYVRQKLISATEQGTGGTAEIGSFTFDWKHLRAVVTDFVVHGTEPGRATPWIQVRRIQLDVRLLVNLGRVLDLSYLELDQPQVTVTVYADGKTNIPTPKQPSTSKSTTLEQVVDLAVGHFELQDGVLTLNSQEQEVNLRGQNLRAQLWYSTLRQSYQGNIALDPLYVVSGRNTPVQFTLSLPLTLGRDRIDLHGARISTAASDVTIDVSLEDMRHPETAAHIFGHLALADLKNCSGLQILANVSSAPSVVDLDANATVAGDAIQVTRLHLGLGHSNIDAAGNLKDNAGNGSLSFQARLAVGELGNLTGLAAQPNGIVTMDGTAKLDKMNNYEVTGKIAGRDLSFRAGTGRIAGITLVSDARLSNHLLDLPDLRVHAWGGDLSANISLEDFARFKVSGKLRHLDLRTAARAVGQRDFGYSGAASGPISAAGDLRVAGGHGINASTRIVIAAGRQAVPMSGRLFADYSGAASDILLHDSYIALPHTRLTLDGSLRNRLNLALTTSDPNDLLAATAPANRPSLSFARGGRADLTASVTGSLTAPRVTAHLAANRIRIQDRGFDSLALDAAASSTGAAVTNGTLTRGAMQAQFAASAGLRSWKVLPGSRLSGNVEVRNGDLADVLALAGSSSDGYSGNLSAKANVGGTVGDPLGTAHLVVTNGLVHGELVDRIEAQVKMSDRLISVPVLYATSGPARINLSAEFQHPHDTFAAGQLHARVETTQINLARLRSVQQQFPNSAGEIDLKADVTGNLEPAKTKGQEPEFVSTNASGDVSARNLRFEGQNYGDLTATARTRQQTVYYDLTSDFAGSKVSVKGNTELSREYPTTADASITNLPIERVLMLAKRSDIPAKGNLTATAHVSGTMRRPQGDADLQLTNAVLYGEPIDRLHGRITYLTDRIDLSNVEAVSGPSRMTMSAKYDHPASDVSHGELQFQLKSGRLDLARIHNVQSMRPGLGGTLQISANGTAAIPPGGAPIAVHTLDGNVTANGIAAHGKNFGDLTLVAATTNGRLNFTLDTNLAQASIHGHGNAGLGGDYPLKAELTFSNLTWTRVEDLLGQASDRPGFEAVVDGRATLDGPMAKVNELGGAVTLSRLTVTAIPPPGAGRRPVVIQNEGPIAASLAGGTARIESFHLTGLETDFQMRGTASVDGSALSLTVNGNVNLAVAKQLNRDIASSGSMVLAATVRGDLSKPLLNGKLELRDASLNYTEFPNGLSHANGVVQFNGDSASVRNLAAESGGGKVTLNGFVSYRDQLRFALQAAAARVRVRPQEGLSAMFDAKINLAGTTQASTVTGLVTIDRITYATQSDIGSLLSRASPPVSSAASPSPLLDNMKLDVRVRTATSLAVQASVVQSLQADANLRIRGTASQPGLLGRITVTEGQLVFFNSTYTVNSGSIAFYNPVRIEPVVNLSLNTEAQGVNVVLNVTGPIDNLKLTYTSDPPLQFQEIVGLLAAGITPTSDPNILAEQPVAPPQTFTQMGESAVVSKAVADPVASRLQRVFGISQLSLDPVFTSGTDLPEARITLQQRISTNMTFTYVTALNAPNTEIVRAEWALNQQWGAIASRDENGIVSVRLTYKRQLR